MKDVSSHYSAPLLREIAAQVDIESVPRRDLASMGGRDDKEGITEYVDHWRTRGGRQHMYVVCMGAGFQIKSRAFSEAVKIAG